MKLKAWHGALLGATLPAGVIALMFVVMEVLYRSEHYIPAIYGMTVLAVALVVIGIAIGGVCGYQIVKANLDRKTTEGKNAAC